ncbi:hypothetical protein [Bradyrhizobium sp. dw_411]|uniref:hypothetical protein n=1 Tax=Bradyrhizobium sp. dw_411 TaxID=2720082 RepID=UPI001BCC7350|nr:hypothetical protein [Bradyrhizobium sp. dw_411]
MRRLLFALPAVALFSALAPIRAQDIGANSDEIRKGHYLAVLMCSSCHIVGTDQSAPVLRPPAPSFVSIAQRVNAEQIDSFLTTTHRDMSNPAGMPNPELGDFQKRQVEAYLLSLRERVTAIPAPLQPSITTTATCDAEIARLQLLLQKARASGEIVGTAPESTAARLHHQPTRRSVEEATDEVAKNTDTAIAFAQKLKAEGLDAECGTMLRKIEPTPGSGKR